MVSRHNSNSILLITTALVLLARTLQVQAWACMNGGTFTNGACACTGSYFGLRCGQLKCDADDPTTCSTLSTQCAVQAVKDYCPKTCGVCSMCATALTCQNGGVYSTKLCSCNCPPSFTGRLCETLDCVNDPGYCANKGVEYCTSGVFRFHCANLCGKCQGGSAALGVAYPPIPAPAPVASPPVDANGQACKCTQSWITPIFDKATNACTCPCPPKIAQSTDKLTCKPPSPSDLVCTMEGDLQKPPLMPDSLCQKLTLENADALCKTPEYGLCTYKCDCTNLKDPAPRP